MKLSELKERLDAIVEKTKTKDGVSDSLLELQQEVEGQLVRGGDKELW